MSITEAPSLPSHVDPAIVRDFDFYTGLGDRPHDVITALRDGPPVFYTTRYYQPNVRGAWILTRGEDVRAVLQDAATFSSKGFSGYAQMLGEDWDLIPIEIDPPDHAKFRALLNPLFSPRRIAELEQGMRDRAGELIAAFADAGACDFVRQFAREFPTGLFLDLMGLPQSDLPQFMDWGRGIMDSFNPAERIAALRGLTVYIRDLIQARRDRPEEDFASTMVGAHVRERPLTDDEVLGILTMVYTAGLPTVDAALAWTVRHLAEHPEQQAWLRANPGEMSVAIDEFLRLYSVVIARRTATRDVTIAGVDIKEGDYIVAHTLFACRDPNMFDQPDTAVLDRRPNRHYAFSGGAHNCVGANLAKAELRIGLEELLRRLPPFRLMAGAPVVAVGGSVLSLSELHLEWD